MISDVAPERYYDAHPGNPANRVDAETTLYIDDCPLIGNFIDPTAEKALDEHYHLLNRRYYSQDEFMTALRTLANATRFTARGELWTLDDDGKLDWHCQTYTVTPQEVR